MADKGKKSKGSGNAAKKAEPVAEKSSAKAEPVVHAKEALAVAAAPHDDHDHHDHDHGGHAAHGPSPALAAHPSHVKEYLVIFVILAVLTLLEVVLAQMGISKHLLAVALVGLALTKAAIVALYYMHLKSETKVLKLTVAIPLAAPTLYAIVLMTEAAWRLTR
jgi:cytochrome c oxidase subunit 4